MSRNIVVCCDGTSNQPSKSATNVAKLVYALIKDPSRQLVYYHPGLGTMAASGFTTKTGSWIAMTAGLAFGYGLKNDLRDAYIYIMDNWRPGDRLFLFGFSRGAYTVRALASLIRLYGLTMGGNAALVPYAVDMMWGSNKSDRHFAEVVALAVRYKATLAMEDCPVYFMGVWDTVSSVGWMGSPVSFPFTRSNDAIAIIRHAVAIDERRAFFRTNLFGSVTGQDLFEVWFPGEHCDVGGGYPEPDSGISKYALTWMIDEARGKGLMFDQSKVEIVLGEEGQGFVPESPDATLHDSMTTPWKLLEFVPKKRWNKDKKQYEHRANLFRRRSMGDTPIVHDVAWQITGYSARLPLAARKLSSVEISKTDEKVTEHSI